MTHVTATAAKDAEAHCLKMGKKFRALRTKEDITRGSPTSEVLFACD